VRPRRRPLQNLPLPEHVVATASAVAKLRHVRFPRAKRGAKIVKRAFARDRLRDQRDASPHSSLPPQDEPAPVVLRRIRLIAAAAWIAFAVPVLMTRGWRGLLGLTCSGLVTMINFLWLEEIVDGLLRPTPARHPWRLTVRTLSRFALLGAALLVTIFVARINAVSVLLGFSIVVVGIMGEAVYSTFRSFANRD